MKRPLALYIALLTFVIGTAQVKVENLLTEHKSNPLGINTQSPRFTWKLTGDARNLSQTAYELTIQKEDPKTTWSSGKVTSSTSIDVPYTGPALSSNEKYTWQVRVWDNSGKATHWSDPAHWQMGLLTAGDWTANWIQPGFPQDTLHRPAIAFSKTFQLSKKIRSATLYMTAHGLYEAHINNQRVGDAFLTPGWTSYSKRLQYQPYDVTGLLQQGQNDLSALVANGWYRGYLTWDKVKNIYGSDLALLAQLEIHYTDGSKETIGTDNTWHSSNSSIKGAEIYDGEIIDARATATAKATARATATATVTAESQEQYPVIVKAYDKDILIPTENEPIRQHETFAPVKILTTPKGEQVVDFGQNLVGWVRLTAHGHKGDSIKISHAEVLDKTGNFYTDNLREARAQDIYILNGSETEHFEPHFTFFGFRYIKVEGAQGALKPEDFQAVALYSDMPPTGTFTCSNPLINQLQHNIEWGQKGNFLDVPTDCPQRDERLGWTGDAQVFSRTAAFNRDVHNFFSKWLKDVAADQGANGSIPFVIPNVLGPGAGGAAGWGDVCTIIPWNMYLVYGDTGILRQQYPSMKAWVNFITGRSRDNLWNTGFHFGDWLFYRPFDDNDGRSAVTDKYLVAQCFYAYSTQLLIDAATVLGNTKDITFYTDLLKKVKSAFIREYMTSTGRLVSGTQTAYVLALQFDMLPDSLRPQAAQRLVANVHSYQDHLTTGFLGTPYLCGVLSRFGYDSVAYALLLQDTYPSWLYPVKMGATTIWERWDGIKPDGSFQTPAMNSFNHYAYGAIGDWLYRTVAGIDIDEDGPGYKHSRIQPHIGGGLSFANADLKTYFGTLSSHWKVGNGQLTLDVEIPANTRSTIYIPATAMGSVTESGMALSAAKTLKINRQEGKYVVVEAGSGRYHFTVQE